MRYGWSAVAVTGAAGAALALAGQPASPCKGLAGRTFGAASITAAAEVAAGTTLGSGRDTVTVRSRFCRAEGISRPTADSQIRFEVWLPAAEDWNGKFQGVGNGGFGGSIRYAQMERPLQAGYAVASTDTGHVDRTGSGIDTSWAAGHWEKFVDYSWRAIHEMTVAAKAVVRTHYGKPAARSYFVGCSNGGRQALMEAQRFPRDYDGIVAGAPGVYQSRLLTFDLTIVRAATATPDSWLTPAKRTMLHQAALAQCGATGGVIDDPSQCRVDPAPLLCRPGGKEPCLTAADLRMVRTIYSGLRDPRGRTVYPGFAPGSEAAWEFDSSSRIAQLATGFFRNIVFSGQSMDVSSLSPAALLDHSAKVSQTLDAGSPDLSAFRAAGGKLIQYHGWNDPRVPGAASLHYYDAVAARLGGARHLDSFYRLFMAPGMGHCSDGPGPHAIGGEFGDPAPSADPEHDVVAALDRWVERGVPPARLIASRYHDDDPAKGVAAQRPWCAHPASSRYRGQGDPNQASSYRCVPPGR